jgi:hypothetical protein
MAHVQHYFMSVMKELFRFRLQTSNTADLFIRTRKKKLARFSGRLIIRLCFHAYTLDVVTLSSDR